MWMIIVLAIAWLGNLIDTISTLYLVNQGFTEINPVMARLLSYPLLFIIVKIIIMSVILIWLWKNRESIYANIASWITCVIYGAISIYYLWFFVFWC